MRVLLTGGGSGGHIYPALAIARGLLAADPDTELLYVGTNHGLERDLVPRAQVPFAAVHARGLLVRGLRGKAAGVLSAIRGTAEAWGILRRFRPDVVVGTGGYVSGPVGLAAGLLNIPLVIQEQNAWPGLTNRQLAKRAQAVLVPFEEAKKYFPERTRVVLVGNPIELPAEPLSKAEARARLGLLSDIRILMATGGSQGALAINRLMLRLMSDVVADPNLGMIWATGKRYYEDMKAQLHQQYPHGWDESRVQIFEYFYEIQTVYQAADLQVCRAGAMTLTDCQAFGMPAVLVPSPNVSEDHQSKNAAVIEGRGAGIRVPEGDLKARRGEILALLRDTSRTDAMAAKMREMFDAHAVERIIDTVREASMTPGRRD